MKIRYSTIAAALLSIFFASSAVAKIGDYGEPVFARNAFGLLTTDIRMPSGSFVTKIAVNSANNVFFSADGGIMAVKVNDETIVRYSDTYFPINRSNYPSDFLLSNALTAIVFAEFDNEEFFFFSSDDPGGNAGLQWGRYTDRVDLRPLIELDGQTDVEVNDLATDGENRLWVSTENGVFEIDLTEGETPQPTITSPYTATAPDTENAAMIADVSALTGEPSAVFCTTPDGTADAGELLYYLNPSESPPVRSIGRPFANSLIGAIRVVGSEIYVVQRNSDPNEDARKRSIVKYTYSSGEWTNTWVANFFPDPDLYDPISGYIITDIDVSPTDGVIWLATTGYAFFQTPASGLFDSRVCKPGNWEDPSDDYYEEEGDCTTPGSGWRHILKGSSSDEGVSNEAFQDYGALLVDRGENVWLGSNVGLRGFIARFLSLNSTRYIGIGRTATVNLDEVDPGTGGYIKITVDTKSVMVDAAFDGEGRMVPITFGFTYSEVTPTPDSLVFTVKSTSDGVPIKVEYFRSAADGSPVLTALASWAEIVEFDDDAFIGGPCFLDMLWFGE